MAETYLGLSQSNGKLSPELCDLLLSCLRLLSLVNGAGVTFRIARSAMTQFVARIGHNTAFEGCFELLAHGAISFRCPTNSISD